MNLTALPARVLAYLGVQFTAGVAALAVLLGTGHIPEPAGLAALAGWLGLHGGAAATVLPGPVQAPPPPAPAPSPATVATPATPSGVPGPAGIGSAGSTTPAEPAG